MKLSIFALLAGLFVSSAQAAVVVNTVEKDGNLETTYSGSLDLTGLTYAQGLTKIDYALIRPDRSFYFNMYDYVGYFDATVTITGPGAAGPFSVGTSSTNHYHTRFGDSFGFGVTSRAARGGAVYTGYGYKNGSALSGGSTTFGKTLADLGITGPATVKFSWSTDSITHNYSVAPVPVPAGLPLVATALGALAFLRRRKS